MGDGINFRPSGSSSPDRTRVISYTCGLKDSQNSHKAVIYYGIHFDHLSPSKGVPSERRLQPLSVLVYGNLLWAVH